MVYVILWNLTVHHTRVLNTHGRPEQLSSMERLVDYSCSQ